MIRIKSYCQAQSLEEAWQLNQKRANRILGGMLWLRMQDVDVATGIDLSALGLDTIEETGQAFAIGCMVTLRQLELHPGFNAYTGGAARQAVRQIVGVQFRNLATVGGSVYGRFGFSDVTTLLLALGAQVQLYKAGTVPLAQFMAMPYDRDILVRVLVPKVPGRCVYQSVRAAKTDFPILTCAAHAGAQGLTLAFGARPGKAMLLPDAPLLHGAPDAGAVAQYAAAAIPTGANTRGSAAYRTHLTGVLAKRAVEQLEVAQP